MNDDAPKCARCSASILDGELIVRDRGDWLHVRCSSILVSADRVRASRVLTRVSRKLIEAGLERTPRTAPLGERHAVLCVACGGRIDSADDVTIGPSGPTHVHCCAGRPA
jgi:hypothetical protein